MLRLLIPSRLLRARRMNPSKAGRLSFSLSTRNRRAKSYHLLAQLIITYLKKAYKIRINDEFITIVSSDINDNYNQLRIVFHRVIIM